jgi:hypothetical protein
MDASNITSFNAAVPLPEAENIPARVGACFRAQSFVKTETNQADVSGLHSIKGLSRNSRSSVDASNILAACPFPRAFWRALEDQREVQLHQLPVYFPKNSLSLYYVFPAKILDGVSDREARSRDNPLSNFLMSNSFLQGKDNIGPMKTSITFSGTHLIPPFAVVRGTAGSHELDPYPYKKTPPSGSREPPTPSPGSFFTTEPSRRRRGSNLPDGFHLALGQASGGNLDVERENATIIRSRPGMPMHTFPLTQQNMDHTLQDPSFPVHQYTCHNSTAGLVFQDGDIITTVEFAAKFYGCSHVILVILAFCNGKLCARQVFDAGIPFVVYYDGQLQDSVSIFFSQLFFAHIHMGRSIEEAFVDAKLGVAMRYFSKAGGFHLVFSTCG